MSGFHKDRALNTQGRSQNIFRRGTGMTFANKKRACLTLQGRGD